MSNLISILDFVASITTSFAVVVVETAVLVTDVLVTDVLVTDVLAPVVLGPVELVVD